MNQSKSNLPFLPALVCLLAVIIVVLELFSGHKVIIAEVYNPLQSLLVKTLRPVVYNNTVSNTFCCLNAFLRNVTNWTVEYHLPVPYRHPQK